MLLQDPRYAVRTPLANPDFAMTAISRLSLAIELNSAVFSIVDWILLQPFPYTKPDRMVVLNATNQPAGFIDPGCRGWTIAICGRQRPAPAPGRVHREDADHFGRHW